MTSRVPIPYFPLPPAQYDRAYMSQVIRAFSVYADQMRNPGELSATSLTLNPLGQKIGSGTLSYNTDEDTIDLTHLNGVVQQIGFETYMRAENATGVAIPNGSVVGFSGVNGEIKVQPYIADGSMPELYFIGVTTFDMANGAIGPITIYGKVRGLNTTGVPVGETWLVGDILYASPTTSGAFTKVRPTAPNAVVSVAAVLAVDAVDGEIMVRPTIPIGLDYGSFSSTSNQTLAAANTATPITFDTTGISNGISIGTPASRLVVTQRGFYQLTVSVQITSTNASSKNLYFWMDKNGTSVANTTRAFTISGSGTHLSISTVYDISLEANDYVRVIWAASDTNVRLDAIAASGFAPASPSVAANLTQVQL